MSFAAIGVGISAISLGAGLYSAANPPGGPTLDGGAGTRATAATLPAQRQLASAMQQGTKVSIPTGRMVTQTQQMVRLPDGGTVPYNAADWQQGGQYYGLTQAGTTLENGRRVTTRGFTPRPFTRSQRVPEVIEADFTGYGDADVQAKIAQQMAQIQLELGDKYGTQFIEEAKKQLALADPEGTAAREKLFQLTQEQANRKPISPIATLLNKQIGDELDAGGRLTEADNANMEQALAKANSDRGDGLNRTLLRNAMESGPEADARRATAINKGMGWLTSGATPEDVDYRATQQNLANLSNFTQGRTPTSQFASLSNSQRGAAPFVQGQPLPQVNPNTPQAFQQVQLGGWQQQLLNQSQTANPWMAGLSTLISGANTLAAGKKG